MILTREQENKAILSNVDAGAAFKITASAKAFGILSSGLYSDKIRAVIRELSCNAYDSHVAAGCKDRQFEVHLPTDFEPWFAVRDYGVGMNKEQVMNLYSTYFESTKTTSNDFVGALGLGSKSPFSYTNNFSVTSTKDGRTGYYSAYINEHGFPAITCMGETDATESAGVEVKFPVAAKDFGAFKVAASRVFTPFEVRPKINTHIPIEEYVYSRRDIIEGASFLAKHAGATIIMGNIAYPLDISMIDKKFVELFKHNHVLLKFDIGQLDFQASREHLSYIPMTVSAINNKLQMLMDELERDIEAKLKGVTNGWEMIEVATSNFNAQAYHAPLKSYVDRVYPKDIAGAFSINYNRIQFAFDVNTEELKKANGYLEVFSRQTWKKVDWGRVAPRRDWQTNAETQHVTSSHKNQLVIEDGSQAIAKSKAAFKDSLSTSNGKLYVVRRIDPAKPVDVAEVKKIFKDPSWISKSSELPALPKAPRPERTAHKVKIAVLRYEGGYASSTWDSANNSSKGEGGEDFSKFSTTKTFYYLPMRAFEPIVKSGRTIVIKELVLYVGHMMDVLAPGFNGIYGVRKDDLPNVEKSSNWINIETYLEKKLTEVSTDSKLLDTIVYKKFMTGSEIDINTAVKVAAVAVDKQNPTHPLAVFYRAYSTIQGQWESRRIMTRLDTIFGTDIRGKCEARSKEIAEELNKVLAKYRTLQYFQSNTPTEILLQYINFVDNANNA